MITAIKVVIKPDAKRAVKPLDVHRTNRRPINPHNNTTFAMNCQLAGCQSNYSKGIRQRKGGGSGSGNTRNI